MWIILILATVLVIGYVVITQIGKALRPLQPDLARRIGRLMFPGHAAEFVDFVDLLENDREQFDIEYGEAFEDLGLEVTKLRLIDLLLEFGIRKNLLYVIQARGEETIGDVQRHCELELGRSIKWVSVERLAAGSGRPDAAQLLRSVNQDLESVAHRIAVLNTFNDTLEFVVLSREVYREVAALDKRLLKSGF